MEPSPAPQSSRRPRRWWLWIAGALVLGLVAALGVIGSYPRWAGSWLEGQLERRLSKRLETKVEIDRIELDYERVRVVGVTLESPALRADEVVVELEGNPLLEFGADVATVRVNGGYLETDREGLLALVEKLRRGEGDDEAAQRSWLRSRVRARPRQLEVDGFSLELEDKAGPISRVRAVVKASIEPRALANPELAEAATPSRVELTQLEARVRVLGNKLFSARRAAFSVAMGPEGPRFPLSLEIEGGATAITEQIAVAQVAGTIELSDAQLTELRVDLSGGFGTGKEAAADPNAKLWSVSGGGKRDLSRGKVVLAMEPFELGRVPQILEQVPGLVDSQAATVAGDLSIALAAGRARFDGQLDLKGLNVMHPLLARDRVEDLDFRVSLDAEVDPEAYKVDLRSLAVERRGAKLELGGVLEHPPSRLQRRYLLDMVVPETDCAVILNAIPKALVPSLQGLRVKGRYAAKVHLDVDFQKLDELELETELRPRKCVVEGVPPALSPTRLRNGFTHRVTMRDGRHRMVRLFAGSGSYAPLVAIAPSMVAAVLTTEDAAFWRHSGFLPKQFGEALKRNLKAGRVRLGASTITMQMVKNVFLSHERTLSRKLQELVLTEYVERTLSKERIMELYLNVIEFAPGVYGVRAAAEHYFGKHPRELTSLEAAYLALMLPSPVRRHEHYCRGELSGRFDRKLRHIHELMFTRGHIPEDDYLMWKEAPLQFDPLREVDTRACLDEIEHLMSANEGQRAVTGLLRGERGRDTGADEAIDAQLRDEAGEIEAIEPVDVPLPDVEDPASGDTARKPAMEAAELP